MRLPNLGNVLGAGFWFLPLVLVGVGAALAFGLLALEQQLGTRTVQQWPFVLTTSPETARSFLSTLATAVATIAATTFSLTLLALTLAAQQYTPKLLHNYLSSRRSQITLGVLAATFTFAILTLQAVRANSDSAPALALTGALVLSLASLGAFIHFLHLIANALLDTNIATDIERRSLRASNQVFSRQFRTVDGPDAAAGVPICSDSESGYVQLIEIDHLVHLLDEADLVLTVIRGAGEFVPRGASLARLSPSERVSPKIVKKVRGRFKIGPDRTHQQDLTFGIYQLVDIAVRSLSPSFNAVTTASTCIDHIGSILRQMATRDLPPWHAYPANGKPRVIVISPTFVNLLDLGFHQVRTFGGSHVTILVGLLEVIASLEEVTERPDRRCLLVEHANHIAAAAARHIQADVDREPVRERLRTLGARLRDAGQVESLPAAPPPPLRSDS